MRLLNGFAGCADDEAVGSFFADFIYRHILNPDVNSVSSAFYSDIDIVVDDERNAVFTANSFDLDCLICKAVFVKLLFTKLKYSHSALQGFFDFLKKLFFIETATVGYCIK